MFNNFIYNNKISPLILNVFQHNFHYLKEQIAEFSMENYDKFDSQIIESVMTFLKDINAYDVMNKKHFLMYLNHVNFESWTPSDINLLINKSIELGVFDHLSHISIDSINVTNTSALLNFVTDKAINDIGVDERIYITLSILNENIINNIVKLDQKGVKLSFHLEDNKPPSEQMLRQLIDRIKYNKKHRNLYYYVLHLPSNITWNGIKEYIDTNKISKFEIFDFDLVYEHKKQIRNYFLTLYKKEDFLRSLKACFYLYDISEFSDKKMDITDIPLDIQYEKNEFKAMVIYLLMTKNKTICLNDGPYHPIVIKILDEFDISVDQYNELLINHSIHDALTKLCVPLSLNESYSLLGLKPSVDDVRRLIGGSMELKDMTILN